MRIEFHRTFRKQLKTLPLKSRTAFERRLRVFMNDPFAPELNNHGLSGEWEGHRSINVTGDIRALYLLITEEHVFFVEIGTHHELYGS